MILRNPQLLSESPTGAIGVNAKSYMPELIVTDAIRYDVHSQEHVQILDLLMRVNKDLNNLAIMFSDATRAEHYKNELLNCMAWQKQLTFRRYNTFLRDLNVRETRTVNKFPMTTLQSSNKNYNSIYKMYLEYLSKDIEIVKGKDIQKLYQHLRDIQKIYEIFSAYILADCFGLELIGNSVEDRDTLNRSFTNEFSENRVGGRIDLYYQIVPKHFIKSWFEIEERPDFTLHFRDSDQIAMFEVRYKKSDKGANKRDKEVLSLLMNNFNINTTGIIYPGNKFGLTEYDAIHGKNYKIMEIPIHPGFQRDAQQYNDYIALIKELINSALSIKDAVHYYETKEKFRTIEARANTFLNVSSAKELK